MSKATLTLDGMAPLQGTAESGGDFIRFHTDGGLDARGLDRLHKGRIEIDGRTEKVMLKSVPANPDADGTIELTLQRFQPSSL
ncbi:hypothetical protein GIY56_13490 [Paracoccus sp. YIM 132242]|uniref:Uncharacterized protein n=1 Tax=Paracoccus lichenicola TaxID=2665644 RepID=A0A6L6HVG6_9RHOB|nr:hypothetical protein [Paracoccus lichenicola]MTE01298.1 hypothetical protein [Paracoccus lichenicola]